MDLIVRYGKNAHTEKSAQQYNRHCCIRSLASSEITVPQYSTVPYKCTGIQTLLATQHSE